jgi:hypothetical protein
MGKIYLKLVKMWEWVMDIPLHGVRDNWIVNCKDPGYIFCTMYPQNTYVCRKRRRKGAILLIKSEKPWSRITTYDTYPFLLKDPEMKKKT